jgi:hypothetical protein
VTTAIAAPGARHKASLTDPTGSGKARAEGWLIGRLGPGGPGSASDRIYAGVTDYAIRAKRVRSILLRQPELALQVIGGKARGQPETFADVFERVYGEPLVKRSTKAAAEPRHR